MKIYKLIDLTNLLELDGMTAELITEAWKVHKIPFVFKWISFDSLEEDANAFAISRGWDLETSLMLYDMPADNKDGIEVFAKNDKTFLLEISKLSMLNNTQCVCQFFENTTLEELAIKINQIKRMKAFL
jgi:hypothetical protein